MSDSSGHLVCFDEVNVPNERNGTFCCLRINAPQARKYFIIINKSHFRLMDRI